MSFDRRPKQYRFDQVEGLPGKFNNLLYIPGKLHDDDQFEQIVCYFGGDIQNFRDEISSEFDHFSERYCYETVGDRLSQSQFSPSSSSILIVQPVSYYQKTFACYHNFVPNIVDRYGTPGPLTEQISTKQQQPFVHLQRLIGNLIGLVRLSEESSAAASASIICQPIKLVLIGFSKGCTVLNQLLYSINANAEMPVVDQGPKVQLDLIKLYFLDSGHNGTRDGWITDRTVLTKLIENCPKLEQISIGVTAYQLGNKNKFHNKQWLAREENTFYRLLNELNLEMKKKNNNKNFKVTRLYLDKSDADNQTGGLLGLHFQIIDRLIEGKLN